MNLARAKAPRCSATAKHSGVQCRQPALQNGKCRFHGGRTPKGDDWHKPRWPDRNAPDASAKLNRKIADLQKRARKREKRLARLSADEMAEHARWQATHAPGSAKRREADREHRKRNREAGELVQATRAPKTTSEENQAIAAQIAVLEAQIRELDLRKAVENGIGVFG